MTTVLMNAVSFILGALTGSLSGHMLIRQVAIQTSKPSRYVALYPIIRLGGLALLSWHLLRWGLVPFILFGGSMVIAMWIVILTSTE